MTNRYRAELILGGASAHLLGTTADTLAAVVSDLNQTQIVERHNASKVAAGHIVTVTFLGAGRAEAVAACNRAGRATGLPFEVTRLIDKGQAH